jgi:hypothetical protein
MTEIILEIQVPVQGTTPRTSYTTNDQESVEKSGQGADSLISKSGRPYTKVSNVGDSLALEDLKQKEPFADW